jgi:hypothetical protein
LSCSASPQAMKDSMKTFFAQTCNASVVGKSRHTPAARAAVAKRSDSFGIARENPPGRSGHQYTRRHSSTRSQACSAASAVALLSARETCLRMSATLTGQYAHSRRVFWKAARSTPWDKSPRPSSGRPPPWRIRAKRRQRHCESCWKTLLRRRLS